MNLNISINYGFDLNLENRNVFTPTPDNEVYHKTALVYVKNHGSLTKESTCETFADGTTNGAEWYSIKGSIADYHYLKHGTIHSTIEVSCDKYPKGCFIKSEF